MKNLIRLTLVAAALGLPGMFAMAQARASEHSAAQSNHDPGGSLAQPGMRARHMGGDMKGMMAKMPADIMMRCQMFMNMAVNPSDPNALLALNDQLQLTPAQTTELAAIQTEARDKAAAVLNAEQKKTLDAMPQSSQTMKDMHEQMMAQMQKMMGAKMGDRQMNCPMMRMMADKTGPTTQAKTVTAAAPAEHDHAAQQ